MRDICSDRTSLNTSGDQNSNRPLVDMADQNERLLQMPRAAGATDKETTSGSCFLHFDDPYEKGASGRERHGHAHHGHHPRGHHSQAESSDAEQPSDSSAPADQPSEGVDQSSPDLSKMSLKDLEALAAQVIQSIEAEIKRLSAASSSSQESSGESESPSANDTTAGASEAVAPASDPVCATAAPEQTAGATAANPATEATTGDQTTANNSDQTSTPNATRTSDQVSSGQTSGTIDQVLAQSPKATGPLSLDAAVNNASVVGFVGPSAGADVDRNATVEFKDMKSYVHLKTGGWQQIEDQNNSEIIGGYWKDDMKGESKNMIVQNSKNDATMTAPPQGYIDHFWLHDGGGTIDPSLVDGFYSTAEARASVPNSGLAASLGIDWFKPDGTSDGRSGGSTSLTDQWQSLYHTTLDRKTLEADPPPGMDTSTLNTSQPSDVPQATGSTSAKLINLFPQSDSQWQQIINDAPRGSLIVSESASDVNPKYDLPFDSIDPALKQHISDAAAAGMVPLGYVGTANGTKPLSVAEAEIDDWYKNADVKGIYLGNSGKADDSGYATDAASKAYFIALGRYIKSKGGMAVINGSGTPVEDYADVFDVQGTVEDSIDNYANYPEAAWQAKYPADRFSAVLGGVPLSNLAQVERQMRAKNNGYIAVADTYPKPMTDEYWKSEIDNLQA